MLDYVLEFLCYLGIVEYNGNCCNCLIFVDSVEGYLRLKNLKFLNIEFFFVFYQNFLVLYCILFWLEVINYSLGYFRLEIESEF